MRTVEKIKAEYAKELDKAVETGKEAKARKLRDEIAGALSRGISTGRLETICNAERDGRCVILPCKVGDTVYEAKYIHKCDRCTNNHIGMCKYEGKNVECPESIYKITERPCTPSDFFINADGHVKLRRNIFLTSAEAAKQSEGKS